MIMLQHTRYTIRVASSRYDPLRVLKVLCAWLSSAGLGGASSRYDPLRVLKVNTSNVKLHVEFELHPGTTR